MKIPGKFERLVKETVERLLPAYSDIKALVLIGSVAIGDYNQDSDVDIVCVVGEKLDRRHRQQLMQTAPEGVQLVPFSAEELNKHFEDCTTMAHSIQKGVVLFDKDGFLQPYLKIPVGPPSKRWMKEWFVHWLEFYFMGLMDLEGGKEFHQKFCQEECHCFISDNLVRAGVNFSILYLEADGVIPVSKGEIRKGMGGRASREILEGLEMAIRVCHEDRGMSYDEAVEIAKTASWFKERLIEWLSVSQEDMAKPLRIYELLKAAKNESSRPGRRWKRAFGKE